MVAATSIRQFQLWSWISPPFCLNRRRWEVNGYAFREFFFGKVETTEINERSYNLIFAITLLLAVTGKFATLVHVEVTVALQTYF